MKTLEERQSERKLRGVRAENEVAELLTINGYHIIDRNHVGIDLQVQHPTAKEQLVEVKSAIFEEAVDGDKRAGRFKFEEKDLDPRIDCFAMYRMDGCAPELILKDGLCVISKLTEGGFERNKLHPDTVKALPCPCKFKLKTKEELYAMSDSEFDKWRASQVAEGMSPITKEDWVKDKKLLIECPAML